MHKDDSLAPELNERNYAPFFEKSPALSAILRSDGVFIRVNPAWTRNLGYSTDFLAGRSLLEFIHPSEEQTFRVIQNSHAEQTVSQQYGRFKAENGAYHTLSFLVQGEGEYVYIAARDVTDDVTKAQQTERDRLLSVFGKAPAPISIMQGPELLIQFANDEYRRIVGQTRAVNNKPIREAFPDLQPELISILEEVYRSGKRFIGKGFPVQLDWEGNGTISSRHYDFVFEPISNSSGVIDGVMTFGFDVSDLVKAREVLTDANQVLERQVAERTTALTAAVSELEAFSYSVSHDLRSPLRGIVGFSQALHEDYVDKLDESGKKYIRYIQEGISKMGHIIDDLLSLSRLSRKELHLEKVDLTAIAYDVIAELQRIERDRVVQVVVHPGLIADADPGLIRIVLQNLLGNAWKFTRHTPNARIEVGMNEGGEKQSFYVSDNGAGFDMAYSKKLFGAFQRLHSPEEGFTGTGIGLATVRRIVHRHGGTVDAKGAVGQGATFSFTL